MLASNRLGAARRTWLTRTWVALACLVAMSCGTTVVDYDTLYISVTAEATQKPIASLDVALHSVAGEATVVKVPATPNDPEYNYPLVNQNLVNKAYILKVEQKSTAAKFQLRVRGLDGDKAVVASALLVIDTKTKGIINVLLKAPRSECDADGDGTPDCKKNAALCCGNDPALGDGDCNDDPAKGASASPFASEDPCTQCGDGIDQDCDGTDTPCVDTDSDGVPDCQEVACGAGAAQDPTVHPGAKELCDGKDNDCNQQIDEDLAYVGIDGKPASGKKDDACGTGVCGGGKIVCAPVDKDGKSTSLVCSSADKKAAQENCDNDLDDDCDGKINNGCALKDIDGDGIENAVEDAKCKFKFARFHAEFHPGAPGEKCCLPGVTEDLCDTNCDGTVKACDPSDKDGDGHKDENKGGDDCNDDPAKGGAQVYPGAAEKCGDGVDQDCQGGDLACAGANDKDGDKWSGPADCNDTNPAINPDAKEVCDGIDNDCNGLIDDLNPETGDGTVQADAVCGNSKGECDKQHGITVCKHYPSDQKPGDEKLDCGSKAFDAKSGVCVGCEGDHRPAKDLCNYLDDDCNGQTDEAYGYTQQDGKKLSVVGDAGKADVACDGVGSCAVGLVECNAKLDQAVCSTDPNGSKAQNKAETCNNQDDDCNGKTDENLTAISDSTCQKTGVCGGSATGNIKTICIAGQWLCDYAAVQNVEVDKGKACAPGSNGCQCDNLGQQCWQMVEASCDGLDNDCDGKTDDDFDYKGPGALGKTLLVTDPCGTGECAAGKVVCTTDKKNLVCNTDFKAKEEQCDGKDNDCDAKTDELTDASMAVGKSPCRLIGQCSIANVVATCPAGVWVCDYTGVPAFEGAKVVTCDAASKCEGSAELTCDAKDNDCDGATDEDFGYDDLGQTRKITQGCGTGLCASGTVVCSTDQKGVTCSTLGKKAAEACNSLDDDCNGKTDETFFYTQQDGAKIGILQSCNGIGACDVGAVECVSTSAVTCSTDPNGSKHQDSVEKCDDLDNNCNGPTDEKCDDDKDSYCDKGMETVGKPQSCPQGGGDCAKDDKAINPGAAELCDGIDNNCDGKIDDIFHYTDPGKQPLNVGDACGLGACAGGKVQCNSDKLGAFCPTALDVSLGGKKGTEQCNGVDDNCNGTTDEGCDDDKDGYCDSGIGWAPGASVTCPKTKDQNTRDCNDDSAAVNPGVAEKCNDVDDNCSAGTDEGCDDDKDGYCDSSIELVGKPKICPSGGNDCNDTSAVINPAAVEKCDAIDNNCSFDVDEGCDDDKDGYCDAAFDVVAGQKVCTKTTGVKGDDCNDNVPTINPGITEVCDNVDNNCAAGTDEGCDDDKDGYCDANLVVVGTPTVCGKGGGDCADTNASVNPGVAEKCNDVDDNCATGVDEGCDDDQDLYCDANLVVVGTPKVCPKSKANTADDCNDTAKAVNPGASEVCDDVDNNCVAGTDEGCDDDKDGYCDAALVVVGKPKVCPNGNADCNDNNKFVYPSAAKDACNTPGVDDNCDGQTDPVDSTQCTPYYKDFDGDTFGTGSPTCTCEPDSAAKFTATKGGDCNDTNPGINPGLVNDTCSTPGVDDNCDGKVDPDGAVGCTTLWIDGDGDKFGSGNSKCLCQADPASFFTATKNGDCDDTKAAVNPSATEICNGGVDDNCDGKADIENTQGCAQYYIDSDGDTYGALGSTAKCLCSPDLLSKYKASSATDCNDIVPTVNPGATETCSTVNVDDNCNGKTDEENAANCKQYQQDLDRDGFGTTNSKCLCAPAVSLFYDATVNTDCNDGNISIHPGAKELCNAKDDNCDGSTDNNLTPADSGCNLKGVCSASAKCTLGVWEPCVYVTLPDYSTPESDCDSKDNNCDGTTDEPFTYDDGGTLKPIGATCTGPGTCKVACKPGNGSQSAVCSCN
jgi:hypothetical protein